MDPEKLQATLTDEALSKTSELQKALETLALLEAQLKEMNPNLDSISEYSPSLILKIKKLIEFRILKS